MADENAATPAEKKADTPATDEGWDLFSSLHREADRLFREFSDRWPEGAFSLGQMLPSGPRGGLGSVWSGAAPAVDVVDLADRVEVRAELPGTAKDDIDLEVGDGTLTIKAHKREEKEEGEKESKYHLSERRYGEYSRTLRLPDGIDLDAASAAFENGVLKVSFPKTEEAMKKPRKVAIQGD